MKKYLPLLKSLALMNLVIFSVLSFWIYFNAKPPGLGGITKKTIWTVDMLILLYVVALSIISIYAILAAHYSTKGISDLSSRFTKKSRFKLLDKNKLIAFLNTEQYAIEGAFYYKNLNVKNTSKIKIKLSDTDIEIHLDNSSVVNFQMDKKYCNEINKLRIACADAIGSELV